MSSSLSSSPSSSTETTIETMTRAYLRLSSNDSHWKILLYVPNLIGHLRLLLLLAFVIIDTIYCVDCDDDPAISIAGDVEGGSHTTNVSTKASSSVPPKIACLCMLGMSIFLDVFDGIAARAWQQCTRFGYNYDIFLDCMTSIVVYGQLRHQSTMYKVMCCLFVFSCTCWCILTMSMPSADSWKYEKNRRPKYWPASSLMKNDGSGHFTLFGSLLWYLGFAGSSVVLYALDRELLRPGLVSGTILVFGLLNMLSFLEYDIMYIEILLLDDSQSQQCANEKVD